EQSSGIEQVNQAVAQMDEVTQQNAALVEEAAAAAGSLEEQAGRLQSAVATFRLAAEDARADRFDVLPAAAAAPVPGKVSRTAGAVRAIASAKPAAKPAAADPEAARNAAEPAAAQPARMTPVRAPRPALAAADNGDWSAF
ncbi:methyl-accepting chemotaxis protein, partial [Cupriavidus lacunae]